LEHSDDGGDVIGADFSIYWLRAVISPAAVPCTASAEEFWPREPQEFDRHLPVFGRGRLNEDQTRDLTCGPHPVGF
jgi:hypothetical protein